MGIGKRIKEARKQKGLTQTELANLIGVTPSAITNYENETSHPKEPVLYKLFEALECDANFLFQDEIKKASTTQSVDAITFDDFTYAMHNEAKDLSPENKQKLLELAQFFKEQQQKESGEENK